MSVLEVNQLKFGHPNSKELEFPNFVVEEKDALLVLGKSGRGKTTLLHLIAGLLRPKSGTVKINGHDITAIRGHKMDLFRAEHLGLIFQRNYFIKGLTALQNVLLAPLAAEKEPDYNHIEELIHNLGVAGLERKKTYELSIGEQQRFNIIRALANKPKLLLADEPTSSLDDDHCHEVMSLLKKAASINGSSLVIVTHDQRVKKEVDKNISL